MGALNTMETNASYGGRNDPGGHRWSPTYSTSSKYSFHLGSFFLRFFGSQTSGAILRPSMTFFGSAVPYMQVKKNPRTNRMCTPWISLFDEVPSTPNGDHMQTLFPREVDISTTLIGAHKPFGLSSLKVRVLVV
jgi:hypothetical protein